MTRADLIAQSARITEASAVIAAYGTRTEIAHHAAFLARGRFSDVIAMAARILTSAPQSAYALTA